MERTIVSVVSSYRLKDRQVFLTDSTDGIYHKMYPDGLYREVAGKLHQIKVWSKMFHFYDHEYMYV